MYKQENYTQSYTQRKVSPRGESVCDISYATGGSKPEESLVKTMVSALRRRRKRRNPAPVPSPVPVPDLPDLSIVQARILALHNDERAKAGLPSLVFDSYLTKAAQNHSEDMLAKGYFSHQCPD